MDNVTISLIPAVGMMIVGIVAVVYWRRASGLQLRWFWLGAGLWAVAVGLKVVCAFLINKAAIGAMEENLSRPLLFLAGGLFLGVQSSLFEIGLTLLAVLIWRQFGRDADRAIGIGVGAGAFESFLLGISSLAAILTCLAGLPGSEALREGIDKVAASTPFFWLVAPVERVISILCHASSRALVLLGVVKRKRLLVLWGFLLFALLDGIAGGAHVSGMLGKVSMWWIELAILPVALVSIPILKWCRVEWNRGGNDGLESEAVARQGA